MIIYFYLFILCRLVESSSIKGRSHKNDLVPFLSSRLDTQKDNSLKIVSNEPFIIQFQTPPEPKENVHEGGKIKDKKKKRPDKKRVSKIKPLRKKIRSRRDVFEAESRKENPDRSTKLPTEVQSSQNQTQHFLSRQEILKALNIYLKKKETKKIKPEEMKNIKDVENPDATLGRKLHRNHSSSLPHREPHVKMIYPKTPKSDTHNYSYKDLIADRERLEQKINYIRNMLHVNDSTAEDAVRIRRKSDSDNTANKIAKMFLTLSAMNGLQEKKSKCRDDDDDRALNVWEKERKVNPSRQSSSSNEERYKIKKWIEYMKNKRSSSKTCPCLDKYNEENDIFPLEQKLTKDNLLTETGTSSEEYSDKRREPLSYSRGRLNKNGPIRNNYKEDVRSKLRALTSRGRKKYDLPIEDLELYRSRAKQILQNAEEILDKIKEEEEKRLAAPQAIVGRLRELTSRIQGDPRSNENDLINIIKKNLGWTPQRKSQSSTDNNSFVENMKSFILDPYEKAKALTDESTRKLSSYLLRNLGKIDSSEEQEAVEKSSQRPQVFHGQVPQTEEMFSANLAKENPESDLLAKEREEHQNWSDTLSSILGGNGQDLRKENTQGGELKQTKGQEESIKRIMEEMIKEQEKQISEHTEKHDGKKIEETTIIDLTTGKPKETPKDSKQSEGAERVEGMLESEKRDENTEKSKIGAVNQNNGPERETFKSTSQETGSDVIAIEHQLPPEHQTVNEKFAESIGKRDETESENDKIRDFPLESQNMKAGINDLTKEDETVAKTLGDGKKLDSTTADENRDEDVRDVVMETGSTFEKGTGDEKGQALESPQEQEDQDDNVESQQGREENDVLNSKHLDQEKDERSKAEKLEAFTEDIQKLLAENIEERHEETADKPAEHERTIIKKKDDSSETKDPEENVAEVNSPPDSVKLQKETTSAETQKEFGSESNALSNGVVQASQDPEESLQYNDLEKDKPSIEKENSAEGLIENSENSAQSFKKSEKTADSAEGILEKVENSTEIGKEKMDVGVLEKEKSNEGKNEKKDVTLKSELGDEKVREDSDDEKVREQLDDEKVKEELGDEKVRESDDEKVRQESDHENVTEELDDEKVKEELDDEKVREDSDEKVREQLDDEKVKEELGDEKVRESDDEKVREDSDEKVRESDDEKVREDSDEKVREQLDDEKVREQLDDEKLREESDDEKVREQLDDEKEKEELDDENVRQESDHENVTEESDDEKVKESDDEKVREDSDEKVREQLDDEKLREESDDEKVKEQLDDEKVKVLGDEKVREESDDENVTEADDEKVKEELDDEKVKEQLDDEKVREESDDEKVRQESDHENVTEESDDENVKEELGDEKVRESDDEKVRQESDHGKITEESDDEKVRELDDKEKVILRESSGDVEQDETNQEKTSLKASLEESDNEEKFSETSRPKYLEENEEDADESADTLASENPENESLESSDAETSLKASKESQEENEEVDGTESDGVSLKASKPQNTKETQDTMGEGNLKAAETEQDSQDKHESQVRAELREVEEADMDNEELSLRSENPEKDTDISNESLMNISGSQEKVEAIHDETINEENSETESRESIDETSKATVVETDKDKKKIGSAEVEKVEQPKETENMGEYSREINPNEDESIEINKTPKLLMSIKKYLEDEEDGESRAAIEDTLNASESADPKVENKNMNEEVPLKATYSEANQEQSEVVQDTGEMDEDDVNVRAENIKDLDNQIEDEEGLKYGELESAKAESEELNEDDTEKMNSIEQKDLDKYNVVGVKQMEPEPEQIIAGKKKNAPASEAQSQSRSTLKVPKSIGKIMKDLEGKEKDDYVSLIKLNPEKIDHIIDKIDEAEHRNKVESGVDCRKECACADEMNIRSRNIGRYEIAKDFLRWVKDLQLNRVLTDD